MVFECPRCQRRHARGPLNGADVYRCLNCGWSGQYSGGLYQAKNGERNPRRGTLIQAQEWLARFCEENGIDWDKLTLGERTQVTMQVPCPIRCWRVGGSVNVAVGEECPECGKVNKYQRMTRYTAILEDEDADP